MYLYKSLLFKYKEWCSEALDARCMMSLSLSGYTCVISAVCLVDSLFPPVPVYHQDGKLCVYLASSEPRHTPSTSTISFGAVADKLSGPSLVNATASCLSRLVSVLSPCMGFRVLLLPRYECLSLGMLWETNRWPGHNSPARWLSHYPRPNFTAGQSSCRS